MTSATRLVTTRSAVSRGSNMQRLPTEEHAPKSGKGQEAVEMARSKVLPKMYVSSTSPIPPSPSKEVYLSKLPSPAEP